MGELGVAAAGIGGCFCLRLAPGVQMPPGDARSLATRVRHRLRLYAWHGQRRGRRVACSLDWKRGGVGAPLP